MLLSTDAPDKPLRGIIAKKKKSMLVSAHEMSLYRRAFNFKVSAKRAIVLPSVEFIMMRLELPHTLRSTPCRCRRYFAKILRTPTIERSACLTLRHIFSHIALAISKRGLYFR